VTEAPAAEPTDHDPISVVSPHIFSTADTLSLLKGREWLTLKN
jgi:hypothetical protein